MTSDEVLTALRCCASDNCDGCPLWDDDPEDTTCADGLMAAAEALKKAEDEREALRETLEKEKKSAAAMDNKALAEFAVLFRQAQETVNRMTEIVDELDEESRPKIYRALDALAQLIKEKAGEAV